MLELGQVGVLEEIEKKKKTKENMSVYVCKWSENGYTEKKTELIMTHNTYIEMYGGDALRVFLN